MSADQHRRSVEQHSKEIAKHQEAKAKEQSKAVSKQKDAQNARSAASRSTSASTVKMKIGEALRHEQAAAGHEKKVAELDAKIATEHRKMNEAQRKLENAEAQERKKRDSADRVREQRYAREMCSIRTTLSEHGGLHRLALRTLDQMRSPPTTITVLFLAANPIDSPQLRLDEEARAIQEMVRKSEHRDALKFETRWAVRPLDVLQAINELRPAIIHFSGHGSDNDEIIFQDNAGNAKAVSKEAIVEAIAATSDDIHLVFFNTCYSKGQAEAVVRHVASSIGMNTAIGDDAARTFSAAFYAAIGFGRSVGVAFRQARAALMLEGISEEDTPELFMTEGVGADDLVLVKSGSSQRNFAT